MAYRVFEVRTKDRPLLDAAMQDDTLSRQSIVIRDARHFGFDRDTMFVLIEGVDDAMFRAEGLILDFGRRLPEADDIYQRIKAEEDEAAGGVGFVFGDL